MDSSEWDSRLYSVESDGRIYLLPGVAFNIVSDMAPGASSIIVSLDCGASFFITAMGEYTHEGWDEGRERWATPVAIGRSTPAGELFKPQGPLYFVSVAPISMNERFQFHVDDKLPGHAQAKIDLHKCEILGKSSPCLVTALGFAW